MTVAATRTRPHPTHPNDWPVDLTRYGPPTVNGLCAVGLLVVVVAATHHVWRVVAWVVGW